MAVGGYVDGDKTRITAAARELLAAAREVAERAYPESLLSQGTVSISIQAIVKTASNDQFMCSGEITDGMGTALGGFAVQTPAASEEMVIDHVLEVATRAAVILRENGVTQGSTIGGTA